MVVNVADDEVCTCFFFTRNERCNHVYVYNTLIILSQIDCDRWLFLNFQTTEKDKSARHSRDGFHPGLGF